MNSVFLINYLLPYGTPVIITATCVSILCYVLRKFLPEKFSGFIKIYFPFIAGIILYFLCDLILVSKTLNFTEETIYSGLLSGTLSSIIFAFIKNLKSGKIITDQVILAIEGILIDVVESPAIKVLPPKIKELFKKDVSEEQLLILIAEEIMAETKNSDLLTLLPIATLIVETVKPLEQNNA